MKCVSVIAGYSGERFELWAEDKKLAAITFSSHTHIARIVSNMGKRLFFFEKKGIRASRTIIKNEYGIKMGAVEEEKNGSKMRRLELDGKNYYYLFNEDNPGELKVYDEEMKQNLLSCSFDVLEGSLVKPRSLLNTKFASLLLMLCWYSFQPQANYNAEILFGNNPITAI